MCGDWRSCRNLAAGLLLVLIGCGEHSAAVRELTVLYTNDEHGWMEGMEEGQGAAGLVDLWRDREGFSVYGPFLLLSGGDNWTGPAISTWVQGQSMVEVMNAMGYDATAIGNHEFDFGLEVLQQRIDQAGYPHLSANTRWRDSGNVPLELGILPYTVKEVNGLRVAIVGLTTISTPRTANPRHVASLQFEDYEVALRAAVNELEARDPDLLFVIAHVCMAALEPLAQAVADLEIDLMGGGHCNELVAKRAGDTILLGGGYHFTAYARARFRYDTARDRLLEVQFGTRRQTASATQTGDSAVAAIVARWRSRFQSTLDQVVAWSDGAIDFRSEEFRQAVVESWLRWDRDADIAITNAGGFRTSLPAGEITYDDLVNVMPFENTIVATQLNGATVKAALRSGGRPVVAGLVRRDGQWLLSRTGEPLEDDRIYRVLVNSFMYDGGDNFQVIAGADPDGFDTGSHYRQPFVNWLMELQTSENSPLRLSDLAVASPTM